MKDIASASGLLSLLCALLVPPVLVLQGVKVERIVLVSSLLILLAALAITFGQRQEGRNWR